MKKHMHRENIMAFAFGVISFLSLHQGKNIL